MTLTEIKVYLKQARTNEITTGEIVELGKNGTITPVFQEILIRQRRIALNKAQYETSHNYGTQE